MSTESSLRRVLHPLCVNSFRHWVALVRSFGGVDRDYRHRALAISLLSPLTAPLRVAERMLFEPAVHETEIREAPVFILGHWRTGTTYLHNLLGEDDAMGYVPLYQTLAPGAFLSGQRILKPLMALRAPRTRPMDNVLLHMDLAQEEEFAMAHLSLNSFYLGWYFPREMDALFRKHVLMEGFSDSDFQDWKRTYLGVLKKATHYAGGKRLVIKNPVNTARIGDLLEMFPDARFVHIYRDPYAVYKSTLLMHRSVFDLVSLQRISDDEIRRNVLSFYLGLMRRYFEDRPLIPEGQLVEVRYEDLMATPEDEVKRIYDSLRLPGWTDARARIAAYIESQQSFKKNRYTISDEDMETVEEHWSFALKTWGYTRPNGKGGSRKHLKVAMN